MLQRSYFRLLNEIKSIYSINQDDYLYLDKNQDARAISLLINKQKKLNKRIKASHIYAYALMGELFCSIFDYYVESNYESFMALREKTKINQEMLDLYSKYYINSPDVSYETILKELIINYFLTENKAFTDLHFLYKHKSFIDSSTYKAFLSQLDLITGDNNFKLNERNSLNSNKERIVSFNKSFYNFLKEPEELFPNDYYKQLEFILQNWSPFLPPSLHKQVLKALDFMKEEYTHSPHNLDNDNETKDRITLSYQTDSSRSHRDDCEAFTIDLAWMPNVVMVAKNILVWLDQLSKKYQRPIIELNHIPDLELIKLQKSGINALWLIGLWERSYASRRIKQKMGNMEAEASAYSLDDNEIASRLGGYESFILLKSRCEALGIRLASDMVPNHTGMDSVWVSNHPDYFMQLSYPPYPEYTFNGENLSKRKNIGIFLEDNYYNKTDASVVFKRVDFNSGDVRYIYHGNDGTATPWNDTAQIDFLNPVARKAVIDEIIKIARNFSIIRFDAAMVLVKDHIRRLWYPAYGLGGAIATRSDFAMDDDAFDKAIPIEFWREVVDRIARELPNTLLLAEAFWMLEGYFVRSLGMHRVYNSAFMDMLAHEDNEKYRVSIKNTQEFDIEILQHFVNFMSNPDEKTAIAQFGDGDKYFGVATMMSTMPGLPMFAHGQFDGLTEKYGMEYAKAYYNEGLNFHISNRHLVEIYPLLRAREIFSSSYNFRLYDFIVNNEYVNHAIFAYSNYCNLKRTLIFYNNSNTCITGHIKNSTCYTIKHHSNKIMDSSNLGHELGLENHQDRFFILQDFITKVEYLFNANVVFEHGFNLMMGPYEKKVFLLVEQIDDKDNFLAEFYKSNFFKGFKNLKLHLSLLKNNNLISESGLLFNYKKHFIGLILNDWYGQCNNEQISFSIIDNLEKALSSYCVDRSFSLDARIYDKSIAIKKYLATANNYSIDIVYLASWFFLYSLKKSNVISLSTFYNDDLLTDKGLIMAVIEQFYIYNQYNFYDKKLDLAILLSTDLIDDLILSVSNPHDFFNKFFISKDLLSRACGFNYFDGHYYFKQGETRACLQFIYFIMQSYFNVELSLVNALDSFYYKYEEKSNYKVDKFLELIRLKKA